MKEVTGIPTAIPDPFSTCSGEKAAEQTLTAMSVFDQINPLF